MNGEAAIAGLKLLLKLPHNPHPWDDLWRSIAVAHPLRDGWWDERNLLPLLHQVEVPVYLGCEGPPFRYVLPGAEGWHATDSWPVPGVRHVLFALRADGLLADRDGKSGARTFMTLGAGLNRAKKSITDPPASLSWTTAPLEHDLDVIGDIELQLDAIGSAGDTAWIVFLQDVDPSDDAVNVTAGYLRASLREVDETASRSGAPVLHCRHYEAVPIGQMVSYRIPLVANARRFKTGNRMRLFITSDDQNHAMPAVLGFRHASVGTSSLNTVMSSSRLVLPVVTPFK